MRLFLIIRFFQSLISFVADDLCQMTYDTGEKMKPISIAHSFKKLLVPIILASAGPLAQAAEQCHQTYPPEHTQRKVSSEKSYAADLTPLTEKEKALAYQQLIQSIREHGASSAETLKDFYRIEGLKDLGETGISESEVLLIRYLAELHNEKQLQPTVEKLAALFMKDAPEEKKAFVVRTFVTNVEALLSLRGYIKDVKSIPYLEWPELSKQMISKLDLSPGGWDHLLDFANTKFNTAKEARLLVNGTASFALRKQLIADAKNTIDVMSWAFLSDYTGNLAADWLIQKHQQGVRVRILVDGQTAEMDSYSAPLQKMEKAGITVLRWRNSQITFEGQHRKMLIIDGQHLIAGGLNFGDTYSHLNPDTNVPRWRDTDIYLTGAIIKDGQNLYEKIWRQGAGLALSNLATPEQNGSTANDGKYEVALINHSPSDGLVGSTIMMTLLKAIRESKESIVLENAYIIQFPALKAEIDRAIKRKVRVRIITNSSQSVDEPVVAIPMTRSAKKFAGSGAEVYLKKGATLHSKVAVFDSMYSMVMSYNLHPRSERIEGEMAFLVKNSEFAQNLEKVIANDISEENAMSIKRAEDIEVQQSPVAIPALRLFFDML